MANGATEERGEKRERAPGKVLAAGETLRIACGSGALEVSDVQPAGRSRMPVQAFVSGRGVAVGDLLA